MPDCHTCNACNMLMSCRSISGCHLGHFFLHCSWRHLCIVHENYENCVAVVMHCSYFRPHWRPMTAILSSCRWLEFYFWRSSWPTHFTDVVIAMLVFLLTLFIIDNDGLVSKANQTQLTQATQTTQSTNQLTYITLIWTACPTHGPIRQNKSVLITTAIKLWNML